MSAAQRTSAGSAAAAGRNDRRDAALHARIRRSAWLLGTCAAVFYVGYLAWNVLRGVL